MGPENPPAGQCWPSGRRGGRCYVPAGLGVSPVPTRPDPTRPGPQLAGRMAEIGFYLHKELPGPQLAGRMAGGGDLDENGYFH